MALLPMLASGSGSISILTRTPSAIGRLGLNTQRESSLQCSLDVPQRLLLIWSPLKTDTFWLTYSVNNWSSSNVVHIASGFTKENLHPFSRGWCKVQQLVFHLGRNILTCFKPLDPPQKPH